MRREIQAGEPPHDIWPDKFGGLVGAVGQVVCIGQFVQVFCVRIAKFATKTSRPMPVFPTTGTTLVVVSARRKFFAIRAATETMRRCCEIAVVGVRLTIRATEAARMTLIQTTTALTFIAASLCVLRAVTS